MCVAQAHDVRSDEDDQLRHVEVAFLVRRRLKTMQLAQPWNTADRRALLSSEIAYHHGAFALRQCYRGRVLLVVENRIAVRRVPGQGLDLEVELERHVFVLLDVRRRL